MYALLTLALLASNNDLVGDELPDVMLVDKATHDFYSTFWPRHADPVLMQLKRNGVVFYDSKTTPPAYQDWDSRDEKGTALFGLHDPAYNISAIKTELIGNANREFPWSSAAGLQLSPNFKAIRFFSLPQGKAILHFREKLPRDEGTSYVWEYPVGTTFGELLLVTDADGKDHTFEVRTRTKVKKGTWRANIFRPIVDRADYQQKLGELGIQEQPGFQWSSTLRNNHPVESFKSTALVNELKPIAAAAVRRLLDYPFVSVLGKEWAQEKGFSSSAPTSKEPFHIVPKNYMGGFIGLDSKSCMNCHRDTLKHAKDFDAERHWYGRIRGSDNIFTFHIFDPTSISSNGHPKTIALNKKLVDAGMLKQHPERAHVDSPELAPAQALGGRIRAAFAVAFAPRAVFVSRTVAPMGRGGFGMMPLPVRGMASYGMMGRGMMMAAPRPMMFAPRAARMGSACAG